MEDEIIQRGEFPKTADFDQFSICKEKATKIYCMKNVLNRKLSKIRKR